MTENVCDGRTRSAGADATKAPAWAIASQKAQCVRSSCAGLLLDFPACGTTGEVQSAMPNVQDIPPLPLGWIWVWVARLCSTNENTVNAMRSACAGDRRATLP